jgi:plastocyanin
MQKFRKRATLYISGVVLCSFILLSCSKPINAPDIHRQPKTHIIKIEKFTFKPKVLMVEPGDLVRWENKDLVPHLVADITLKKWQSQNLLPNDSFTLKIKKPTSYICKYHPTMQAKLVLQSKK